MVKSKSSVGTGLPDASKVLGAILPAVLPAILATAIVLVLIAYLPSPYIGDDYARVVAQSKSFGLDFGDFMQGQLADRPVLMLAIWIGLRLHGTDPAWFKLTGVFWHAGNAVLLYALALRALRYFRGGASVATRLLVGLAVFAWAVHPTHWSSIVSVIQFGVPLGFTFALATYGYFLRLLETGSRKYLLMIGGFYALALLTKGTLVLLPLTFWLFPLVAGSRRLVRDATLVTFGTLVAYGAFMAAVSEHHLGAPLPFADYWIAESKIFFWSFGKLFSRTEYHFIYDAMPFLRGPVPTGSLYGLACLFAFAAWARLAHAGRGAWAAFGAYVSAIFVESVIRLPDLYFDHRLYAPTGLALFFFMIHALGPRGDGTSSPSVRFARYATWPALASLAILGAVASVRLGNEIDSPEHYLMWEINGPWHPKDYALFAIVLNFDVQPEKRYYEAVSERALVALRKRYPDSPMFPLRLDAYLFAHYRRKRATPSLADEAFARIVRSFVRDSADMSVEAPLMVYYYLHRFPQLTGSRLKRFLLLLATGRVLETNLAILDAAAVRELPSVRYFWSQISLECEDFARNPLTVDERARLQVGKAAYDSLETSLHRLVPGVSEVEAFLAANRARFDD